MFLFIQAANKKVGSVKSGASKKGDGLGPSKAPKAIEPEDVEVNSNILASAHIFYLDSLV